MRGGEDVAEREEEEVREEDESVRIRRGRFAIHSLHQVFFSSISRAWYQLREYNASNPCLNLGTDENRVSAREL